MNIVDSHKKSRSAVLVERSAVVFFLLAAVGALFSGCSGADPKQQKAQAAGPPRAVSVAIAPVQKQDVPVYLSGLGAVTAFNTANIKGRVDGQIMRRSRGRRRRFRIRCRLSRI